MQQVTDRQLIEVADIPNNMPLEAVDSKLRDTYGVDPNQLTLQERELLEDFVTKSASTAIMKLIKRIRDMQANPICEG